MGAERPPEATTPALVFASGAFLAAAVGVAWAQGVHTLPGECGLARWEPLRALPWLAVASVAPLVYAVVVFATRRAGGPVTVGDGPYRQSVVDPRLSGERPRGHLYVRALLVVVALALGAVQTRRWVCPELPATCQPATKRIVIVGVGMYDPALTDQLVSHFRDCYELPVALGRPVEMPPSAWNADRQQWTGEDVLDAMPDDPGVLLIGVTSDDIYTRAEKWRYAFGLRNSETHKAILSTQRMPSGGPQKYAARMIAFEYCGLSRTSDPKSVRADSLMGPNDLDAIDETVW